jgi:hypothetical protein
MVAVIMDTVSNEAHHKEYGGLEKAGDDMCQAVFKL